MSGVALLACAVISVANDAAIATSCGEVGGHTPSGLAPLGPTIFVGPYLSAQDRSPGIIHLFKN